MGFVEEMQEIIEEFSANSDKMRNVDMSKLPMKAQLSYVKVTTELITSMRTFNRTCRDIIFMDALIKAKGDEFNDQ